MRQGIANDSDFTNKCNRCGFDFESGLACRIFGLIIVKLLSGIGCCRVFPTVQAIYSLPVIDIGRGRADIRNCSASYKNARLHVRFRRIAVHLLCAVSFIESRVFPSPAPRAPSSHFGAPSLWDALHGGDARDPNSAARRSGPKIGRRDSRRPGPARRPDPAGRLGGLRVGSRMRSETRRWCGMRPRRRLLAPRPST